MKFRVWNTEKSKFDVLAITRKNVMQYTDLYDKFGDRICEGDVVKYTEHKGILLPTFEFEVVKENEKACFGYYYNDIFVAFAEFDELKEDFLIHCQIIGNKFKQTK